MHMFLHYFSKLKKTQTFLDIHFIRHLLFAWFSAKCFTCPSYLTLKKLPCSYFLLPLFYSGVVREIIICLRSDDL